MFGWFKKTPAPTPEVVYRDKVLSDKELIEELIKRGFYEDGSSGGNKALDAFMKEDVPISFIAHRGLRPGTKKCSKCHGVFPTSDFPLYKGRVDKNGYLMFSNSTCFSCSSNLKEEKNKAVKNSTDKGVVFEKPKDNICPECNREWDGAWHMHHVGDVAHGYICGQCNMSKHDHRKKANPKKQSLF